MQFDIDFHSLLYRQWEVHFERGVLKLFPFHPVAMEKCCFMRRSDKFVSLHKTKVCFLCNLMLILRLLLIGNWESTFEGDVLKTFFHPLLYRDWKVHFEKGVVNFFHPLL